MMLWGRFPFYPDFQRAPDTLQALSGETLSGVIAEVCAVRIIEVDHIHRGIPFLTKGM